MARKRIGILTGGGDVPGLNAIIKTVTYRDRSLPVSANRHLRNSHVLGTKRDKPVGFISLIARP